MTQYLLFKFVLLKLIINWLLLFFILQHSEHSEIPQTYLMLNFMIFHEHPFHAMTLHDASDLIYSLICQSLFTIH